MAGTITTRQTILLKGDVGEGIHEYIAAENNILPGMLLQLNVDGQVITNNEAAKRAEVLVAMEDSFLGMSITGARPDTSNLGYMIGDVVRCRVCEEGDELYMILVSGENADMSEYLTSNADGKLQVAGAAEYWMFKTVEASDATAADKRVVAQVL